MFRELDESVADEDIYLDEFRDEIDGWVIDAIKAIGIDTAKAVLNAPREMLIEKTDLEEETVDEVIRILKSEFEEEEPEEEKKVIDTRLIVECGDVAKLSMLFSELQDRGFKCELKE